MGLYKRIVLVIKSLMHSTGRRIEDIAAEEELDHAKILYNINPQHMQAKTISQNVSADSTTPRDYIILGVKPDADLDAVELAWRNLAKRADPKRFPSGSEEERKAAEILKSINDAYERIREAKNPTEGRFGQLEL